MFRATRSRLALRLALGAVTCAASTVAAAPMATPDSCVAPRVNVVVPPGERWQSATADLTEHLRAVGNLDRCASVQVRPSGAGVLLEITTSDSA